MRRPPFSSEYEATSRAPSTVIDFIQVPGAITLRTIWATIQPLDAAALQSLEPGLQRRARFACFTYETLNAAKVGGSEGDLVEVNGELLEVHGGFNDGAFPGAPIMGHEYILAAPEISQ